MAFNTSSMLEAVSLGCAFIVIMHVVAIRAVRIFFLIIIYNCWFLCAKIQKNNIINENFDN